MKRSIGASILAVIAAFAGVLAIIDVLRYMQWLFSPLSFLGAPLIGGILAAIVAAIWFWAAQKLWNGDEQGWIFLVVIAIFYLILDFVSLISGTPWELLSASIIISALTLVIAFLPGTRESFGR